MQSISSYGSKDQFTREKVDSFFLKPDKRTIKIKISDIYSRCVGREYRINSTVNIPVSVFDKPGFVSMFENYVTSLIEGTAQGKTLIQLVKDFEGK